MRKVLSAICLILVALAAPTAGLAVNVSSNDGSGTQYVQTWYANGAWMEGNLKSTIGDPVYYEGLVVIGYCEDHNDGRYTGNVTSTSFWNVGGSAEVLYISWPCELDGTKARVCKDRNNLPDVCGGWSALMPR